MPEPDVPELDVPEPEEPEPEEPEVSVPWVESDSLPSSPHSAVVQSIWPRLPIWPENQSSRPAFGSRASNWRAVRCFSRLSACASYGDSPAGETWLPAPLVLGALEAAPAGWFAVPDAVP